MCSFREQVVRALECDKTKTARGKNVLNSNVIFLFILSTTPGEYSEIVCAKHGRGRASKFTGQPMASKQVICRSTHSGMAMHLSWSLARAHMEYQVHRNMPLEDWRRGTWN